MEFDEKQKRAIILTIVAILLIVIIFLVISVIAIKNSNRTNINVEISTGYTSIKQIVEANGCKYKKDTYLADREYPTEVELNFKYDLYTDDESNEEFYMKLINELAQFLRYTNLKLTDEDKDITIEILCKDGSIYSITINGIADYFIYMDSQISVSKYQEIKSVSLNPTSDVLRTLVENNWSSNIDCGTRDSIFQNYFIFFDEGIKYRKIGSSIYNIIFTDKYLGEVVDNVSTTESINSVKSKLGEPTFENKDLGVVGYKGNSFYAFFNGKEISIYKKTTYDYSDFWKLIDEFVDEEGNMTFKEFMNELTYIWPDYSEYTYDSDYMFISYPNRGIDVKLNYENESGILVYNNISENLNKVQRYLENTEFISKLQLDNVYRAEIRRVEVQNSLDAKCNEFIENLKDDEGNFSCGESNLFKLYMDLDENGVASSTYFISKDGNYVDREFNEAVNSFAWISDIYFVYGVYGKGIYLYNVLDTNKRALTEGSENFLIKKYEDNILYFDNAEMPLAF